MHRSDLHVELFRYEIARGLNVWHLVSLTSLAVGQMRRLQQGMQSVRSCLTPPHLLSLQSCTRAASRGRGFRDCWNIGGDPPGFVMREQRPARAPHRARCVTAGRQVRNFFKRIFGAVMSALWTSTKIRKPFFQNFVNSSFVTIMP